MKKVQEMRVSKRFIQYTMGFLLGIALLCGCGKKEENYQLAKDQVFRFESLPYKITESEIVDNVQRNRYVTKLDYLNNKIYLLINVGEYPVYDDGSGGGVQPLKDGGSFIGIEDLYIEDASVQDISSEDPSSEDPSAEDPSAEDPEAEDPEDKKLQEDIIEPVLPPDFAQPRDYYELVTLDADGSNTQVVELESLNDITNGQYAYMSATDFDSSGDLYATLTYSAPDKNNTEIWTEYTTLCKFNHQDGSLLWSKEVEGLTPDYEKGEYFYLTSMTCLDDGSIGLIFDGSERFIMYFDNQGNSINRNVIELDSTVNINQMFFKQDGTLLIIGYVFEGNSEKFPAYTYDPKTKTMSEPIELPFSYYNYSVYQAPTTLGVDLIMSNAVGLYTYTFGETQLKPLMNFVNSDFPASYLNQFAFLDQETFVAMYYNEDDYSLASAIFHYVDPSEIPDKKILVLGVNGYWGRISTMVREFNKSNEEYRIVLRDYSQYNTNEDYMAGYTKLNNDILAGDIPDILSVSNAMPLDSYRSQGLFLDWRPLYEADEELKHVELMENVLNTISGGEKWYYMFSEFSVQTVIGREEFVGSPQDWNLDKFLSLAKADPQRMMFSDMTQSYFLSQLMSFCGNQFIDPATGKCDFTSDTFIKLLEYTATLPAEIDYSNLPEDYYIERNNQYRNGTTLLQWGYLDSVSSFKYFYVDMGEEVVMLGFPGENGGISNLSYNDAVTISSKTKNKDGAWEFIKFYLSEEMAEKYNYGQFPIRRDSFDMKADEAMERPYYMQGDERVYYDDMYYIDGEQIIMEPLTAAQVEEIVTFVEGISSTYFYNEDILNIINEDAAAYFSGQKSVDEVARIIQSRAQVYVNENR